MTVRCIPEFIKTSVRSLHLQYSKVEGNIVQTLFDLGVFENLLFSGLRSPNGVEIVKDGKLAPLQAYSDISDPTFVDVDLVQSLYRSGFSIVLNAIHKVDARLARFARQLERGIPSANIQINSYLTPALTTCFNEHADAHHVLVIQCAGSKKWWVEGNPNLGVPNFDHTLKPGELLYIPKGVRHRAHATDTPSLHLTVGITFIDWRDLLRSVVAEYFDALDLPPNDYPDLFDDGSLVELKTHVAGLQSAIVQKRAVDRCKINYIQTRRPIVSPLFSESDKIPEIVESQTEYRCAPDAIWAYMFRADYISVYYLRREIRLPVNTAPILDELERCRCITPAACLALAGISMENSLSLLEHLRKEGLLTRHQVE